MKNVHQATSHAPGVPGRSRDLRWMLGMAGRAACMTAFLCLPIAAEGANDGSAGQVSTGGDETVGTLPIIGRQNVKLPVVEGWRGNRPAFYLEGAVGDIQSSLLGARGIGFISVEVLDPAHDLVRVAFHGSVSVSLDRDLMETLPIRTGLAVPSTFGPVSAVLTQGTQASRALRLRPGLLRLDVSTLSSTHVLDGHPLDVRTLGEAGRTLTARVYASRDTLILRQSN